MAHYIEIEEPELTSYQEEILNSESRFTVVIASTKVGKTFMMIWYLFKLAHSPKSKAGNQYFWLAPTFETSKIAFDKMKELIYGLKGYKTTEKPMLITCPNGAIIKFLSADNPSNIYGQEFFGGVFDEFSRVTTKDAWVAIMSTVFYTKAPIKLIGNYVNRAWVNDIIKQCETDPDFEFFRVDCYDAVKAGLLDIKEVEAAKRRHTKAEFQELYLGIASDNNEQLIQDESIQKIFINNPPSGTKYLTIDVARMGADRTIALVWDGLKVIESLVIDKGTLQEQLQKIQVLRVKHNINSLNTIADENGIGGFFVDSLNCIGFINNASPTKKAGQVQNFASLKDEALYKMMEMVNANLVGADLPEDLKGNLIEELQQVKFDKTLDTQKVRFRGKSEIKKIINRSPDVLDSFMMRFFWELNPNYGIYHIY